MSKLQLSEDRTHYTTLLFYENTLFRSRRLKKFAFIENFLVKSDTRSKFKDTNENKIHYTEQLLYETSILNTVQNEAHQNCYIYRNFY